MKLRSAFTPKTLPAGAVRLPAWRQRSVDDCGSRQRIVDGVKLPLGLEELVGGLEEELPSGTPLDRLHAAVVLADQVSELADALVGHFVEAARGEGCSWSQIGAELGVSKQAAQQRFSARPGAGFTAWSRPVRSTGRPPSGRGFLSRFPPAARQVITGAEEESRALRHEWVGTEHLLLSMLRDPGSSVSRALASVGVDVEAVGRGLVETVGEGAGDVAGPRPFTARAKRVLEMALKEGLKSEAKQVEPEHILFALLREGQGVAASMLVDLGASLERVRDGLERAE